MADVRINALSTTATSAASDDYLALDGSANGTRKILATNIAQNVTDVTFGTSGPSAKSSIAARAARQGLVFDGTANATGTVAAFGATDFSVFTWVNVTSFASARSIIGGGTGAFVFSVNTSGALVVGKYGSADLAVSTSTLTAGKNTLVGYVRSGTTGTYYIDGIAAGTTSDSYNYTAADSQIGANGGGSSIFLGVIDPIYPYNRALSAAEVVSLYEAGVPSGADYNNAGTSLIGSTFINDPYAPWTYDTFSGASATGFSASSTSAHFATARCPTLINIVKGRKYRFTCTLTLTSGTAPQLTVGIPGTSTCMTTEPLLTSGANVIELTAASTASSQYLSFFNTTATNYTISNITFVGAGLLLAPDAAQAGGGLTWYDTSGNAANITLPASGVTWNVPTSGNVTSGGALNLRAGGTNQNITFTPSGTGVHFFNGFNATAGTPGTYTVRLGNGSNDYVGLSFDGTYGYLQTWGGRPLYLNSQGNNIVTGSGNVLVGATIDGGQKLQVNGSAAFNGVVSNSNGNSFLSYGPNGSDIGARIWCFSDGAAYIDAGATTGTDKGIIRLRTGSSLNTALTLDSSQNATFAGTLVAVGNSTFKRSDNTGSIRFIPTSGVSAGSDIESFNGSTSAYGRLNTRGTHLQVYTGTSANTLALTVDDSQRTILSGALRLNNTFQPGAPTATGYVTIQDSAGNTYKVLVGT